MTDLTSAPELVKGALRRHRWRRWRRLLASSASPRGFRRGLVLIVLPSLLLVGLEIYQAIGVVPGLRQSQALVARSFEIVAATHSFMQAMQDAETGQRGFLITGDDNYLKPYEKGVQAAPVKLDELRQLTREDAEQQRHVGLLAALMKTKLDELKQTIAERRQQGFEAARRLVGTNIGADAMTAITAQTDAVIATENRLLDERQTAFLEAMRIDTLTSALAAVLAFAIILLGGLVLWRAYRRMQGSRASLRRSEERFRLLVSGVRDYALFMLDPAGNVASWNGGAERVTGYRAGEILGAPYSRFFGPEQVAAGAPSHLLEVAATAGSAEDEGWRLRKDGSPFWASAVVTALRDPGGELRGFAKIVRDMTERRRQQEALEQSQAAMMQLQKMEAIGHLTGGVAHDFNNLLQSILGSVELMQRPGGLSDPARVSRLLETTQRAAERGAALTHRLLAFARRQPLAPQVVDVNKLMGSMSELLYRTLGETIAVETVSAAGLWRTHVDPNQLENAILNLAVNARDAMPQGGKLTIETGNTWLDDSYASSHTEVTPGQYVQIAVSDSGDGMAEEVMAHAFEPFFTTKPEGRGTGLGLAQVHGFVKQSGGHIKLYSEVGHGTTVKIYLPRYLPNDEPRPSAEHQKLEAGAGRATVLLVEDDEDVRLYGAEALRALGYSVFEATEGQTALRILDENPGIALLFTDVGLPGLNGRGLAEEARRRSPNLKILYTTGYARNAIVHNGILDAGVDLLGKPFTTEALARKLEQMLGPA
ncbi:MAG: CHASE3 domain-containing protein, partial [Alphaproteobacteria bacterium]|nr:CHASE3 domain-containing protein [Alphaproteobacteria bacterium]